MPWINATEYGLPDKITNDTNDDVKYLITFSSGDGFALSGDLAYPIKAKLISKAVINSSAIQSLISDNKTLAQIKADIEGAILGEIAAANHTGRITVGNDRFKLADINLTPSMDGNFSVLAKVMPNDNGTQPIGSLAYAAYSQDGCRLAKGTLDIKAGKYSGKYNVIMSMGGLEDGRAGAWGNDRNGRARVAFKDGKMVAKAKFGHDDKGFMYDVMNCGNMHGEAWNKDGCSHGPGGNVTCPNNATCPNAAFCQVGMK
jgi:hypothetical protein